MICFHHDDLDGRCAAAIVLRAFPGGRSEEAGYGRPVPVEKAGRGEKVFIVDFTFPRDAMSELLAKTGDVTWIDHHFSALRVQYPRKLAGILSPEKAACELAWDYLFPGRPAPEAVRLTGDKDTWAWKYGDETAFFNEGIRVFEHHPEAPLWKALLDDDAAAMAGIKASGATCVRYRRAICADYVNRFAFETVIEGRRAIAVGLQMFGSETFGERAGQYDLCLTFEFDGRHWSVSLFSETVDVSGIAEKYGGGGHRGAAGFTCSRPPFPPFEALPGMERPA